MVNHDYSTSEIPQLANNYLQPTSTCVTVSIILDKVSFSVGPTSISDCKLGYTLRPFRNRSWNFHAWAGFYLKFRRVYLDSQDQPCLVGLTTAHKYIKRETCKWIHDTCWCHRSQSEEREKKQSEEFSDSFSIFLFLYIGIHDSYDRWEEASLHYSCLDECLWQVLSRNKTRPLPGSSLVSEVSRRDSKIVKNSLLE